MRPVFVDNQDGNTMARALLQRIDKLREQDMPPEELCIASAYFNPQGLELLSGGLGHIGRIRLLLGADPTPEASMPQRGPFDPPEPEFTNRRLRAALDQLERGIRADRNRIPFEVEANNSVCQLLEFLQSGRIEVRRYEQYFLHAKAFLFRGKDRGVLVGSSNLTRAGLRTNLELNLGHYDDPLVSKVESWFEELWEKATTFDLAAFYEELLAEYDPYIIYLRVLWQLYSHELMDEQADTGKIPVTTFQKHGVWRAKRIIAKYGGALVADGVGLGKTFTAGEIIHEYRDRRQRVLLICPASLRDTNWKKFLNDWQLMVDSVSYEQLANDVQLGGEQRHLDNPVDDYALVVIDEAHNYRNPDTPTRAAVLRRLLSGKRRDLLMLTATPVNNSLWDLYHILRFFMKQDAALAEHGVLSIRERFEDAMQEDPFDLNPDLLYPIIDATTVKRPRSFVMKHYPDDRIRGPEGKLIPIRFPKPVPSSINYDLDEVAPGFFGRFEEILMPERGVPLLKMARYQPERYLAGGSITAEDSALVGLLRSALLKRFESSVYAFRRTLERMLKQHRVFLDALERGKVIRKEFFKEISAAGDEGEIEDLLDASENTEDGTQYNIDQLRQDVSADQDLLQEMYDETSHIDSNGDPKLRTLVEELVSILKQAHEEAVDDEDERQKRKVLVFSHFEDTIDWIEDFVRERLTKDKELGPYADKVASVSGSDARRGINRQQAICGFAPITTGALPPYDGDVYDLLLCTDVLAEGMNLQQCRNIINYDLPWNPMRLVQRHGRIDRIGSRHDQVFLRTFFPDKQLDILLNLEERVRRKLAQAAASVGVEVTPIERGATGEQSFTETREEIEKLHKEDPTLYEQGGTTGAAQTGEEYRQELRKAIQRFGDRIDRLPWRIGSGMIRGSRTGHFFCAEVADRVYLRFVPLEKDEAIVSEIGTCLRLIQCTEDTPSVISSEMVQGAFGAWARARDSIYGNWIFETDPANLQPKIRRLNRQVAHFLRSHPSSDIPQDRLTRCLESVEAPWSRREENQLRLVWTTEFSEPSEKVKALVEEVESIGAEPFRPPEPLPPIEREDIYLVCWMAIQAE